eukprot:7129288-Prorocentrum_lima.AAC.1
MANNLNAIWGMVAALGFCLWSCTSEFVSGVGSPFEENLSAKFAPQRAHKGYRRSNPNHKYLGIVA